LLKEAGEPGAPPTSPSSSAILSADTPPACDGAGAWSPSLRKLLARVPVCGANAHTDGFLLD